MTWETDVLSIVTSDFLKQMIIPKSTNSVLKIEIIQLPQLPPHLMYSITSNDGVPTQFKPFYRSWFYDY